MVTCGYLCVTSITRYCMTLCCVRGVTVTITRYCMTLCCVVTSVTWWLPAVTMCYQRYQVLHDSMLCTRSTVTSVTWWLPAVTMCYQRYQVLHDSMLCMLCIVTSFTLWLPLATGVTWYCRTLGCIHEYWSTLLPQLGHTKLICCCSGPTYPKFSKSRKFIF